MSSLSGQRLEEPRDMLAFEKARFGWRDALHWDLSDLLARHEHLRYPSGKIFEEGVENGQSLIASSDVIPPVVLQVVQERENLLEGEVFDG
jgi:hypothetical protein